MCTTFLAELRARTRAAHDRLEVCVDIERRCGTRERYRALLWRFSGLYVPLEARLERCEGVAAFGFEGRRKAALLRRDWDALSGGAEEWTSLPLCDDLPPTDTKAQAAGCLYVMEGATLGGQIIGRIAQARLGLDAANGAAFFHSYGSGVGRMWKDFCRELEAYGAEASVREAIAQSACDTFAAFARWLGEKE